MSVRQFKLPSFHPQRALRARDRVLHRQFVAQPLLAARHRKLSKLKNQALTRPALPQSKGLPARRDESIPAHTSSPAFP